MIKRSSFPIEVIPIQQSELRKANIYTRVRDPSDITEFTLTRFLVPFLAGFDGWVMFVDSDFLFTGDLRELAELIDDRYAVMCAKHDYTGKATTLMDGQVRGTYPRLNWSSMILFNCSHPKNKILTPEFVGTQPQTYLQKLMWLEDDDIGSIPQTWNFLVGHCELPKDNATLCPKAIHFTEGGPWYDQWKSCQFSDLWFREQDEFERSQQVQSDLQDELVKLMPRTCNMIVYQTKSGVVK
ncbi:hypothetical protein O6H91_10G012900 [Diphasiastrum complanatum]|nr:hypothetical protein O6H91_10G012900 [Diphasiastrum complanatum]